MALPLLLNAPESERLELFARKLHFCCKVFDFINEGSQLNNKEIKRVYLNEVTDYIESTKGVLNQEPIYALSIVMIGKNIFRIFPPKDESHDPDEDDPIYEPAWPHLNLVYLYFMHFIGHPDFQPNIAKKFMDDRFVGRLVYSFGSPDAREREILKGILHKIYGKFLGLRGCIRKSITNIILSHLYDDVVFDGIPEILEVLGSIINGYVRPLKPEHLIFLHKTLLPLHASKDFANLQPQLVYCIVQYMDKDPSLTQAIVKSILRYWPKTSTQKEVLFLGELEELIDVMQPSEFQGMQNVLLKRVAERALFMWENEYILSLIEVNAKATFPLVLPALIYASKKHWNESIRNLATTVRNTLKESNYQEYSRICGLTRPPVKPKDNAKSQKTTSLWKKAVNLSGIKSR